MKKFPEFEKEVNGSVVKYTSHIPLLVDANTEVYVPIIVGYEGALHPYSDIISAIAKRGFELLNMCRIHPQTLEEVIKHGVNNNTA